LDGAGSVEKSMRVQIFDRGLTRYLAEIVKAGAVL
jgi:hypothetical protein